MREQEKTGLLVAVLCLAAAQETSRKEKKKKGEKKNPRFSQPIVDTPK